MAFGPCLSLSIWEKIPFAVRGFGKTAAFSSTFRAGLSAVFEADLPAVCLEGLPAVF
jgi:hypothetical protein